MFGSLISFSSSKILSSEKSAPLGTGSILWDVSGSRNYGFIFLIPYFEDELKLRW